MSDYIEWLSGTQKGFMEAYEGDGLVMERPWIARGTVQSQTSPTLTTNRGGVQESLSDHQRVVECLRTSA